MLGFPGRPMSRADVDRKFKSNVSKRWPQEHTDNRRCGRSTGRTTFLLYLTNSRFKHDYGRKWATLIADSIVTDTGATMSIETNRRDALAGAAVSGLVASVLASSATGQGTSVMAVATDADYQRDPTRWGSPEMAAHFPGFQHLDMRTSGAIIRLRHGGSGPPLLLVHGNPENHTCWYKVAGKLAQQYHVVLPDLRGYGDSSLPDPGPNNINFSFREMARDLI